MIWDELTTVQIDQVNKNTPVLLILAATEQHGPHLPLATDRLIGEHFAKELHKSIPNKILILPTISVGCSSHHMSFSGSLTISHDTFIRQVEDIVESVIQHGFTNIVLFNSHGGNQAVGQVVLEKLGIQYSNINFVLMTWWKLALKALVELNEGGPKSTGHAGEFETSLMLLIAPHLVSTKKLKKGEHNKTFKWAEGDMLYSPTASYFRTTKEMTTNGIYGNPLLASAKKGRQITKIVNDALKIIITDMNSL